MLVYLDTCIVIYAVEGQTPFQQRAHTRISALEAAGYHFLVSDLSRAECLVHPLGRGDGDLLLDYQRFFLSRSVFIKGLTPSIYDRAARIRGQYRYTGGRIYGLADASEVMRREWDTRMNEITRVQQEADKLRTGRHPG